MSGSDTYTRWAVLAAGEGGGRIASNLFGRADNPGIDDRILVMNTNRADIRNTIDRMEAETTIDTESIELNHTVTFGDLDGVGNYFPGGEACAEADLDRIIEQLDAAEVENADAFLYVTTLGGGTGNGSVPYLINSLKSNPPSAALDDTIHVALAAWPYSHEGGQRHFNAVCGLSRLLRWYDGSQNADMVVLISNSHIADDAGFEDVVDPDGDRYSTVNEMAISAMDLMIGAGRETRGVVDVSDYVTWPSRLDAYHFTPGVALEQPSVFELDLLFDKAADNGFVPLDPTTSRVVYGIVRAPTHLVEQGEYSEAELDAALHEWLDANGYDDIVHRMTTLTPVDRRDDTLDVLLMFGGFDLDPLLSESRTSFDAIMEQATERGIQSDVDTPGEEFSTDRFRAIRRNLEDYLSASRG
ncbi:hypothetical protein HZS55_04250 [Halosimplex rubrum]|uniref:Tubulin/FtsZ GTPase domain-containing protein n=1 Tax=Halosimplex rubrum TaxID=869889 RepID=A0A7D5NYL6_9EURY|nr:hypothetical protein [Halosimplex rubrum]QLH76563.1 hypothetical protein HZS55_04250 [Halosimplex rubrum]